MNGNLELACWWCGEDIEGEPPHWHLERPYHKNCRREEIHQQTRRKLAARR